MRVRTFDSKTKLGDVCVDQIKWDYAVDVIPPGTSALQIMVMLDDRGEQGFELVQVYDSLAYFKRLGSHETSPEAQPV